MDNLFVDIDECSENSDNCSQNCSNTIGSYLCSCNDGFTLGSDQHTCNGINMCMYHSRMLILSLPCLSGCFGNRLCIALIT